MLSPGQAHDLAYAEPLLANIDPQACIADKAYDADAFIDALTARDITAVIPKGMSEKWADNWCILANAPHPKAAHAWINFLLEPRIAAQEMNYHNYAIPNAKALALTPKSLRTDPMFNVPVSYTDNYRFILNLTPDVVNKRTKVYTKFKAS